MASNVLRDATMFNKKQNKPVRKLSLNRETIKRLTENLTEAELKQIAGGRGTAGCGDDRTVSQNGIPC